MRSRIKISGLWFERYSTRDQDFVNYLGGRVLETKKIAKYLIEWIKPESAITSESRTEEA